jgi:adenine-specific DNA-methyltransferase
MNLEKILQYDARIWDEDILDYPQLFELARTYDKDLLDALFKNKDSKEKFFMQVGDSLVFKYNDFRFYLEENQVNNSFTQYANKIGLASQGEYLSDSTDYVLDWPYKDCVLEGGMSSEEDMDTFIEKKVETTPGKIDKSGNVISPEKTEVTFSQAKRKREEIFYNNIIADKEIDRLLDKKALKNFTRYTANGEEKVQEIKRDEDGTIKENLLIKGNNLLALHSLKEQFAGKVKLIYIDPPYNTGNDGFAYNDRFNHSTWLTFMKNRLKIAKDLLRDDGLIYIQLDDNEVAYLTVLMDQIYGRENRVNIITVKSSEATGVKLTHVDKKFPKFKDFILIYKKSNLARINPIKVSKPEWDKEYNKVLLNFTRKDKDYLDTLILKEECSISEIEKLDSIFQKVETSSINQELKNEKIDMNNTEKTKEWLETNAYRIFRTAASSSIFKLVKEKKEKIDQNYFTVLSKRDKKIYVVKSDFTPTARDPRVHLLFAEDYLTAYLGDIWYNIPTTGLEFEGGVQLRNGKKPELLLQNVIESGSNEEDIVMDFHLGSGTTAAVAHKLNRHFIGVEQLEYSKNSAKNRMINVIAGEQSGISKDVNWKGGGDFIYFELAEYNEEAKDKIDACKSYKELKKLFTELTDYYFLNYNVSVKQFNDQLLDDKDFQELSLEEQKTLFKALLDNNQLYIPYKEQEDGKYNLSKKDQELTNEFYG